MSAMLPHSARRKVFLVLTFVLASVALAGCGTLDGAKKLVDPYKYDVVQGNFVSKEQVDALQPGMSRQQVRDLLGTPLLVSVFHANRWDYVFTIERQKVERQQYKLTIFFNGDLLERYEGDTMPTEAEFVSRLDAVNKTWKVPVLEASEESLSKYPSAGPAAPPPPAAPPANTSYPPLEAPAR